MGHLQIAGAHIHGYTLPELDRHFKEFLPFSSFFALVVIQPAGGCVVRVRQPAIYKTGPVVEWT